MRKTRGTPTGLPRVSILGHGCFADNAWVRRRLTLWQSINMLHAADHLAPYCVLAVQKACIVKADEKLAVGGVRIIRPRH